MPKSGMLAWLVPLIVSTTQEKYAGDTKSPETVVAALYDVISGPIGQKRDWERFNNLFAPGAKMAAVVKVGESKSVVTFSPEDYVKRSGPFLEKEGFFEKEVTKTVQVYGSMAHVFTTYESRLKEPTAEPFDKGINSIQLTSSDGQWKVHSILWTSERTDGPIPEQFMKGS